MLCHSLDDSKLTFIERDISPTWMTVRLATGASVTVMKHVVNITYTLKEVKYDDYFIILDLDDEFDNPWFTVAQKVQSTK